MNRALRFAKRSTLGATCIALAAVILSACTTNTKPIFENEQFGTTSPFSRNYAAGFNATCEASRRALLSQGYVISQARPDLIDARKSFQQDSDNHYEIEFHVVCAAAGSKDESSTAFVNAVQERFALKKTPSSASVGVGAVGAVSLPFGSSNDSLVKVASETIHEAPFYDRFFELVEYYLVPGLKVPVSAEEPKKPAPGPTPHSD